MLEIIDLFGGIIGKANIKGKAQTLLIEIPKSIRLYVTKHPQALGALALYLASKGGGDGKA